MRKRKTPVLMISALVGLLAVIAAINSGVFDRGGSGPQADNHGHEAPAVDMKGKMAESLAATVGNSTEPAKPTVPEKPTVLRDKPVSSKQAPHDNMTNPLRGQSAEPD